MRNNHCRRAMILGLLALAANVCFAQSRYRPSRARGPRYLSQRTERQLFSTPRPLVQTVSLFNIQDSLELPDVSKNTTGSEGAPKPAPIPARALKAAPVSITDGIVFQPPATVTPPPLTGRVQPATLDVIELYNGDLLVTPEPPPEPLKAESPGVASLKLMPPEAADNIREPGKVNVDTDSTPALTPIDEEAQEEDLPPAPVVETPPEVASVEPSTTEPEDPFDFEPIDVATVESDPTDPKPDENTTEPHTAEEANPPTDSVVLALAAIEQPELKAFVTQSLQLADRNKWLQTQLDATKAKADDAATLNDRVRSHFDRAVDKERKAGLTTTLGLILTHEREHLPNARQWRRHQVGIKDQLHELSEIEFHLEQQQRDLATFEASIGAVIQRLASNEPSRADHFKSFGRGLVVTHESLVKQALTSAADYSDELTNLDSNTTQLLLTIQEFESYIDKNVLWIRSHDPIGKADLANVAPLVTNLSSVSRWGETIQSIVQAIVDRVLVVGLTAIAVLVVFVFGVELNKKLKQLGEASRVDGQIRLLPTVLATCLTALIALVWPLFIWTTGWAIASSLTATPLALAVGYALQKTGLWFATFSIPRAICLPDGLAQQHFRWNSEAVKSVYRGLPRVMVWGLPIVAITAFTAVYNHGAWSGSVGRIAFIAGTLVLAYYVRRGLHPESGFLAATTTEGSWVHRMRYPAMVAGLIIPIALGITSAAGYHRSALELIGCFEQSWLTAFLVAVTFGVLMLCVDRMVQTLETGKLSAFSFRARVINPTGEEAQAVNEQIELKDNREQVHRFLKVGAIVACLATFWGIWHNVLPALNVVNDIPLWSIAKEIPTGTGAAGAVSQKVIVTLGDAIRSLLFLFVTIAAARNLPGLLDTLLLRRLPLDRGGRHAVATICRYVLTTIGVLLTLKQIGIDWASMQWMVAAMTVGLGFGLQEIFANFVSGLIILLERPIRLGDFVTVNGKTGFVTRIQFRATTITDLDRRELLVPNKKFITDELINWTLSDPITRLVIPVGIAYGSDTSLTHRLLMEVATEHPVVLNEPESSAVMTAFGDSTLNFELRVFIPRRDEFSQITHELNTAIERKFRAASIEIAFPQCDVNVRGLEHLANLASRPAA